MTRLPRYTRLSRGGPIKASSKPMAKRGATKAKKAARYKAYLSSAAWKRKRAACIKAAFGMCQMRGTGDDGLTKFCTATEHLTVHHLTYARFGNELPEDLQCLCRYHHDYVSAREGRRVS